MVSTVAARNEGLGEGLDSDAHTAEVRTCYSMIRNNIMLLRGTSIHVRSCACHFLYIHRLSAYHFPPLSTLWLSLLQAHKVEVLARGTCHAHS